MDEKMEEVEEKEKEKGCVFEDSLEIDFDYEFDVAKFFDFMRIETFEEIVDAESWFELAPGHAPSPLLAKLDNGADSVTSSPRYGAYSEYSMDDYCGESQVSSIADGKKGSQMQKSKSKSTSQTSCLASSRLLQPTASLLAKKNKESGVCSTRVPTRHQKLGNPPKSTGETDDTKRQKLEIGYLRKVAQLKHQTSLSHKSSKNAGTTGANSHVKPKATIPKEPHLATAHRGVKQRSKNAPHLGNDANYDGSSSESKPSNKKIQETQTSLQKKNKIKSILPIFQDGNVRVGKVVNGSGMSEYKRTKSNKASQQVKSDQGYNSKDCPLNKKIVSGKGDNGVLQNCTRETIVPKDSTHSTSKKMSRNPSTEFFSKVLKKKSSSFTMKENKNSNAVTGNLMRCSGVESRMFANIVNHLMRSRCLAIC